MSRYLGWFFLAVLMLALSAPLQALNYEVGGCKTGSSWVNFTTISAAVAGVPAGATIQVCPGVYPEQVTITQPLTLKGIRSGNTNRAVIAINPNGAVVPNVTIGGQPYYAQVLVQNVSPAGPVNITGITVDGAGANAGCSTLTLAGIFYDSSTTGTVNEVTVRNQVNNDGCGWGILLYNGSSTNETITVENSSFPRPGHRGPRRRNFGWAFVHAHSHGQWELSEQRGGQCNSSLFEWGNLGERRYLQYSAGGLRYLCFRAWGSLW
jgi:hypothetical protein